MAPARISSAPQRHLARRHPVLHLPGQGPDGSTMSTSTSQQAAIEIAMATVVDLLSQPRRRHGYEAVSHLLEVACDLASATGARKIDTRTGVYAGGFARRYVTSIAPAGASLATRLEVEALARLDKAGRMLQPDPRRSGSRALPARLVWRRRDGITLIDDLSAAGKPNLVAYGSALTRAAAHLALGQHLPQFGGVRICAPRIPLASVHIVSTHEMHQFGGCAVCTGPHGQREVL